MRAKTPCSPSLLSQNDRATYTTDLNYIFARVVMQSKFWEGYLHMRVVTLPFLNPVLCFSYTVCMRATPAFWPSLLNYSDRAAHLTYFKYISYTYSDPINVLRLKPWNPGCYTFFFSQSLQFVLTAFRRGRPPSWPSLLNQNYRATHIIDVS